MILDTCYFIDVRRGTVSHKPLQASGTLFTTVITYGELAEGLPDPTRSQLRKATFEVPVLGIDVRVALMYGQIRRGLRLRGLIIGENDLWIAAIAVAHNLPLVTRNVSEFARVPGIQLLTY